MARNEALDRPGEQQTAVAVRGRRAHGPAARWVDVNTAGVRVENCRQFGGPWLALQLIESDCNWMSF